MMTHLACIMDGNRRWATGKGWLPLYGHREGIEAAKRVINFCLEKGVAHLSLYMFSMENLKRLPEEKNYLFELMIKNAITFIEESKQKQVNIRFIGDRTLFPDHVRSVCEKAEQETAHYNKLHLNLFFCYGSQQEIVDTVKRIIKKVKDGVLSEDELSLEMFKKNLWTQEIPDPDLIIRAGGKQRLSNFLLYQAAYSEFYFLDCLWPDVTKQHLTEAVEYFNNSKRNFGV